ncbi:MAG: hypothetical protein ACK54E_21115 [Pseudanabaena sp.]
MAIEVTEDYRSLLVAVKLRIRAACSSLTQQVSTSMPCQHA